MLYNFSNKKIKQLKVYISSYKKHTRHQIKNVVSYMQDTTVCQYFMCGFSCLPGLFGWLARLECYILLIDIEKHSVIYFLAFLLDYLQSFTQF